MVNDQVPQELIAGDTWSWVRAFGDYPAPTWTVTYYFENKDKQFSAVATASGTDQLITITAATTSAYPAGRYRWYARAVNGAEAHTAESGWVEVTADPSASGVRDHRSWARRTLDAIEATLEGRASNDQLAMTINSRSISRTPISELTQWRDKLRQEVRADEDESGGAGRDIKVGFSRRG
jgi:hypothetical protein